MEKLVPTDLVIIFSGSHTAGKDIPSEARQMYGFFAKRLKVLKNRIRGGIDLPERPEGTAWDIRIGNRKIAVRLEEDSVDTEDNAERSVKILQDFAAGKEYGQIVVQPLSSNFHAKRIGEAFGRYVPEDFEIQPVGAEDILKMRGGKYAKYGKCHATLESAVGGVSELVKRLRNAVTGKKGRKRPISGTHRAVMEVCVGLASRTAWGRKKIRQKTSKRVGE
jgi:hypothetical protein